MRSSTCIKKVNISKLKMEHFDRHYFINYKSDKTAHLLQVGADVNRQEDRGGTRLYGVNNWNSIEVILL